MENSCAFTNDFLECLADSLCAPLLEELDLSYTGISTMCAWLEEKSSFLLLKLCDCHVWTHTQVVELEAVRGPPRGFGTLLST